MRSIRHKLWHVREVAASALGRIGDARAVGPLASALYDNEAEVRKAVQSALKQIDTQEAREVLAEYPERQKERIARGAAERHARKAERSRSRKEAQEAGNRRRMGMWERLFGTEHRTVDEHVREQNPWSRMGSITEINQGMSKQVVHGILGDPYMITTAADV